MTLLIGAISVGLILAILGLGVFISFRIFGFADLTAEGSFALGAALVAALIATSVNPVIATALSFIIGFIAGCLSGILHTKLKLNQILAGILVMTSLYSVNLHIMGKSNLPVIAENTIEAYFGIFLEQIYHSPEVLHFMGWEIQTSDLIYLLFIILLTTLIAILLYAFFRTNLGASIRAAGDNQQMIRALSVNTDFMIILGLGISNGLIALSGALMTQYQGFADAQIGLGMLVTGLASVIIGTTILGSGSLILMIFGTIFGSVIFRILIASALTWGMNPNDLKLITAVFVLIALVLPMFLSSGRKKMGRI